LNLMPYQYLHQASVPKQEEEFTTKARKDEVTKKPFFRVFPLSCFRDGFWIFPVAHLHGKML